jgi:hypothetical protein
MNPAARVLLGLVMVLVLAPAPACGATTTPSTTAAAMPNGFPSDFPVYPGARLTHANQATANGQTTWGVEWETLDNLAAVQTFYMSKLNQGDWTISSNSSGSGGYSATFTRKSNPKDAGLLTIEVESSVTHITLALETA